MLPLDSSRWSELSHAYGIASQTVSAPSAWHVATGFSNYSDVGNTPALLQHLEENPHVDMTDDYKTEPWYSLWGSLCHQGDAYTASYAAVPHIVRIAFTSLSTPDWQFFGLPTSIEIARATGRGPAIPDFLADAYFAALQQLHDLAHHCAHHPWDDVLSNSIAAALVATKGQPILAETILALDPDTLRDFRIQQVLDPDPDDDDN